MILFLFFCLTFTIGNGQQLDSLVNETRPADGPGVGGGVHVPVRNRRSNFPCGQSFVPCTNELDVTDESQDEPTAISSKPIGKFDEFLTKEQLQFVAVRVKTETDKLFNETERQTYDDFRGTEFLFSTLAWNELRAADRYAKDMSYSALISIGTTERIKEQGMSVDAVANVLPLMLVNETVIKRVCPLNVIADCIPGKYRTYSGHCNNVQNPLRGATYEPMQRLIPPAYADGVSRPRVSKSEIPLTSARQISRSLFGNAVNFHRYCTLMLAHWAEFVYADFVHLGSTRLFKDNQSLPLPCCAVEHPECMPIITEADDLPYAARGQCISYSRTFVAPRDGCNLGTREQANIATSFLDGSHLYGSTHEQARRYRAQRWGQLRHAPQSQRRELLPPREFASGHGCASTASNRPCFDSASALTNLMPGTAAFQTIWLRQHNSVARQLQRRNSHWDDERLYQESRRVIAAQIQHITYNEFVPILVGQEQLSRRGLQLRRRSFDSGYDMNTNPSVLNEYAAAVGLFFFALLPDTITQVSEHGLYTGTRQLSHFFNDPTMLYVHDKVESIVRHMIREPIIQPGLQMSSEFREHFLRGPDQYGIDLAALIIQQGRDHGLNGYTEWREACGLKRPRDFDELSPLVWDSVDMEQLRNVYAHVDDGDLFVLGLAEKPERGALLGPTFACILSHQFERARHGDRFWFENFFQPSAFSEDQLMEIRKTSLAAVICDNTDSVGLVQPNVFQLPDDYGRVVGRAGRDDSETFRNCPIRCNMSTIPRPNFDHWIDQEPRRRLPITQETLEKALRTGAEQFRRLQEAERKRQVGQSVSRDQGSAVFAHAGLMAPKKESLDRAQAAGVLRETTKVLLRGTGLDRGERLPTELDQSTLQQLLPQVDVSRVIGNFSDYLDGRPNADKDCLPKPMPCDHTSKYRSASGWCNNLRFPAYGNAFEPFRRLLDPAYEDGFDTPRTVAKNGRPLPSARTVSVALHNDNEAEGVHFSHMLMQFGQILDHDFTHSPLARGPGNAVLNCSRCDSYQTLSIHCFPISIEPNDPHFPATHSDGTPRCIPFARSLLGQVTLGYRNQLNQLTSFLDASYIYGSTECEANTLRLFNQGKLNFTDLGFNREALPQGSQERDCRTRPQHPCFNAGDERNNIQPGLATIHTLTMREHNRIAVELHRRNNFWSDEQLYQEARRINVAKLQHVVYNEWLPIVLGCETMARYDLMPKRVGYYEGYDPTCDGMVSQEFSVAAFRFGHTLIRNVFPRMDSAYNSTTFGPGVELKQNFNNATAMYSPSVGHMESVLMGLLGSPSMVYDRHIANAVRNHLFQKLGGPFTGLDLIAVNLQRARDHGVQGYNAYRETCGLPIAVDFDDLRGTMDESAIQAFRKVYANVDDIDLFSGMIAEKPLKGALVGPMIACVVAEQFQRAKRCDRFYYETNDPNIRFTSAQLMEIRKSTFSKMICQNSEFAQKIQPNPFLLPDDLTNAPIDCGEMLDTDLDEWIDRKFCLIDNRVVHLGKTKRITPCITCTCTTDGTECHSMTVENCDDLLKSYTAAEIRKDTVCMIQCSRILSVKT